MWYSLNNLGLAARQRCSRYIEIFSHRLRTVQDCVSFSSLKEFVLRSAIYTNIKQSTTKITQDFLGWNLCQEKKKISLVEIIPPVLPLTPKKIKNTDDCLNWFSHPCAQKDGWVVPKRMGEIGLSVYQSGESIHFRVFWWDISAIWSDHPYWVQRAIGLNPVTLMRNRGCTLKQTVQSIK